MDSDNLWVTTSAEPRPRDRRAEARQIFIPGAYVLAGATAFGVIMLVISGGNPGRVTTTRPVAATAAPGLAARATPLASSTALALDAAPTASPSASTPLAADSVVVVDGTGTSQAGATRVAAIARMLAAPGRTVTSAATTVRSGVTTIYYPPGQRAAGREIALALPGTQHLDELPDRLQRAPELTGAVVVVVARDAATMTAAPSASRSPSSTRSASSTRSPSPTRTVVIPTDEAFSDVG